MSIHLKTTYTIPQEREFEAWIVQGIEEYLNAAKMPYAVWAVSPKDEKYWPGDEALTVDCKLVGLQFKQAKIRAPFTFDRLHWSLHDPVQFARVQANDEIFYCLPTFINREFRKVALEHCVFWRPDGVLDLNVWYDNPRARTPYKKVGDSMRWGRFIEQVMCCNIGKRLQGADAVIEYIESYRKSLVRKDERKAPDADSAESYVTYFVAMKYRP